MRASRGSPDGARSSTRPSRDGPVAGSCPPRASAARPKSRILRFTTKPDRCPMAWVSLPSPSMTPNKNKSARRSRAKKPPRGIPEEDLQGPPAAETIVLHDDRALQAEEHLAVYGRATSPRLTGGDLDADWERADHVGEE